jgi:pyridine nucleotide-disulfide oxidoreductase family protein
VIAGTKSIVLLGVGHTNAHVVHEWASNPIPGCTLTCISKFPNSTYSGMLPATLGRQFNEDEMRIDLQVLADRAGAQLILDDTCGLDLAAGEVLFSNHPRLPFDALSIGVGSMPLGWQEHASSPLLVPVKPMQTFLQRLSDRFQKVAADNVAPIRVAIVGGGVASVEIAFCLHERLAMDSRHRDTTIEIFTSSHQVADGMRDRSVRHIEKLLELRGIAIHTGQRVREVGETEIVLENGDRHSADCVIWATGAAAPPVLSMLGLETDSRGFIATSGTLQSLTDPRIFAVGDSGTVIQTPAPKAGVYAVRQCPILWHNLQALISGAPMRDFKPQSDFLKLLNTGDGKAILEYHFLTVHASWCWKLKTWIDKRFVREFQH